MVEINPALVIIEFMSGYNKPCLKTIKKEILMEDNGLIFIFWQLFCSENSCNTYLEQIGYYIYFENRQK